MCSKNTKLHLKTSNENKFGIFPPPLEAQEGLNILINHFLGKDWHVVLSMSQQQVNYEAIREIIEKFPKKKSLMDFLKFIKKGEKNFGKTFK